MVPASLPPPTSDLTLSSERIHWTSFIALPCFMPTTWGCHNSPNFVNCFSHHPSFACTVSSAWELFPVFCSLKEDCIIKAQF